MQILFLEESNFQSFMNNPLTIGGWIVPKDKIKKINNDIKNIKMKHGIKALTEIKWTKIGKNKLQAYKELIDYAIKNKNMKLRVLVAKDKSGIKLPYKEWYSRLHYSLLNKSPFPVDGILSDKKGNGFEKMLNQTIELSIKNPTVGFTDSRDSQIIQISDIFLGAISACNGPVESKYKKEIIEYISSKMNIYESTPLSNKKDNFNIFYWKSNNGNN